VLASSFFGTQNLRVSIVDVDTGINVGTITIRHESSEYDGDTEIVTGPSGHSIACDASGICLVAWRLYLTTRIWDEHFEDSESVAIEARAFNVRTGELGPELRLDETQPFDRAGPSAESLGDGRFRVTAEVDGQSREYLIDVR